jgi:hypothetical protein
MSTVRRSAPRSSEQAFFCPTTAALRLVVLRIEAGLGQRFGGQAAEAAEGAGEQQRRQAFPVFRGTRQYDHERCDADAADG